MADQLGDIFDFLGNLISVHTADMSAMFGSAECWGVSLLVLSAAGVWVEPPP
jgi:hypothetical protein